MRRIYAQELSGYYDRDSGREFSDITFEACSFQSCGVSITLNPALRSVVRNVRILNCSQKSCVLHCAKLHDVIVDGLETSDALFCRGALFEHVTFKGRIGEIVISPKVSPAFATMTQQRDFDEKADEFYSNVDWALDIREAEFEICDINGGLPARLIRRDPETQVIVTRERVLSGQWRELDLADTYWPSSLESFLKSGDTAQVLVAPKRNKKFKKLLKGLQLLREAGFAEPE